MSIEGVATLLLSPKGRVPRRVYWAVFVVTFGFMVGMPVLFAAATGVASQTADGSTVALVSSVVIAVLMLLMMWSMVAVQIKRLHDLDQSGWLVLLNLIPITALFLVVWLGFFRGQEGDNRFGPPYGSVG